MQGPAAQDRQALAEAVAERRIRTVAGRGGGHAATAFPSAARPPAPQRACAGGCVPSLARLHKTPTPSGRHRSALLGTSPATCQLALLPRLATVCSWLQTQHLLVLHGSHSFIETSIQFLGIACCDCAKSPLMQRLLTALVLNCYYYLMPVRSSEDRVPFGGTTLGRNPA